MLTLQFHWLLGNKKQTFSFLIKIKKQLISLLFEKYHFLFLLLIEYLFFCLGVSDQKILKQKEEKKVNIENLA